MRVKLVFQADFTSLVTLSGRHCPPAEGLQIEALPGTTLRGDSGADREVGGVCYVEGVTFTHLRLLYL